MVSLAGKIEYVYIYKITLLAGMVVRVQRATLRTIAKNALHTEHTYIRHYFHQTDTCASLDVIFRQSCGS
jgi:hypothetical protein